MLNSVPGNTPPNPSSSEVSAEEVQQELDRILASDLFLKSPQLSRFLRFCVDETLAGQQDCLKEQVLGTDVFRRPSPFDPRLDPIVRVEARRLRSKLDQYYSGEGATDPVVISFQRGDYTPRFIRANASDGPAPVARSARIVVVEDERIVARDLENRLRNLGYQVVGSATSGEAALQQVQEQRPDMVLMDIVLAGSMRGTEVARRIWSEWRIPVVYLTAFSDALILEDVKGSEPYGYILKPFDSKQLHAVLQLALSRHNRESADVSVDHELSRSESLLSALLNARIRPWDWIVRDSSLPWPDSVEATAQYHGTHANSTPSRFLERVYAPDRERVQQAFTDAIREKGRLEFTYRRLKENGAPEWVIGTGTVATDAAGRLRCAVLEIGASSAIRPNEAAKVSELERFVQAAGHDLQEPLRTVKAYTQLLALQKGNGSPVPETILSRIEGGVDQMHALVSSLLTYTGLAGDQPAPIEPVSLDEAVDAAVSNLEVAIVESGATITRSELPEVLAARQHLVQLFQNLISNAVKYRREGVAPTINIDAQPTGAEWLVSVRDNGAGFDPGFADQIFQAFQRLSDRTTPGTGLGLAICRRVVETYGGRIWAESAIGQGSVFRFTLPRACAASPQAPSDDAIQTA